MECTPKPSDNPSTGSLLTTLQTSNSAIVSTSYQYHHGQRERESWGERPNLIWLYIN